MRDVKMILSGNRFALSIIITGALIMTSVTTGRSEVLVFDGVTTVQTAIRIKVLTKGRIFAQGGRLVDVYLGGCHLKKILTGGDGYGYLKYIPQRPGYKEIEVRSDANSSTGLILVMGKKEKAIIIDVEGAFKDTIFSEALRKNSSKIVNALSESYRVIYLSRYVGKGISRSWLEEENFPKSVILRWQGADTFEILRRKEVALYAVIGSAAVMSAAEDHIEQRYTFEKSKAGQMVQDWNEILKLLLPAAPPAAPREDPK